MYHCNHYAALGIPFNSSENEIRTAFKRKAKEYHPDRNSDPRATDWFQTIKQAYEVLMDVESRATYDFYLQEESQRRRYERWMWEQEHCRQTEEYQQYYEEHTRWAVQQEHDQNADRLKTLEDEITSLKATNQRLWDANSVNIAKIETVQREKGELKTKLTQSSELLYQREREFVSKIESLEKAVGSLQQALREKKNKKALESSEYQVKDETERFTMTTEIKDDECKSDHHGEKEMKFMEQSNDVSPENENPGRVSSMWREECFQKEKENDSSSLPVKASKDRNKRMYKMEPRRVLPKRRKALGSVNGTY